MGTLFWQLNPAAPHAPLLQDFVYKSAATVATNKSQLVTKQQYIKFVIRTAMTVNPSCKIFNYTRSVLMSSCRSNLSVSSYSQHKDRAPTLRLTSPALLLVVLAEDAALGVGERCRVTRAMVDGLQPWRAAKERRRKVGGRGGAPVWEDAPLRLSLSPGRICLVRLSSNSTWLLSPGAAPFRSCSARPQRLSESSWAGSHERFPPFVPSQ